MKFKYIKNFDDLNAFTILNIEQYKNERNAHLFAVYVDDVVRGMIGIIVEQAVKIIDLDGVNTNDLKRLTNYVKKQYIKKDIHFITTTHQQQFLETLGFTCRRNGEQLDCLYVRKENPIDKYLDYDGLIEEYPMESKDNQNRLIVLKYIIEQFDENKKYSEQEVNEIITSLTTLKDYATLRRELYENLFLDRTRDCKEYWVKQ